MGVIFSDTLTVTVDSCIKNLKKAGVLDLWFEPIYKSQEEEVYTLGILETFKISVKDKRAYYGSEDITNALKGLQLDYKNALYNKMFNGYDFHIKDLILSKTGCITKESYLSQWLAIDLT